MHTLNHPHTNTQICCLYVCKIAHNTHIRFISSPALKGYGGSRRGEVSGASTDWLLGCPWRQHMGEERAGMFRGLFCQD